MKETNIIYYLNLRATGNLMPYFKNKIVTENKWFYNLFYNKRNFPIKRIEDDSK